MQREISPIGALADSDVGLYPGVQEIGKLPVRKRRLSHVPVQLLPNLSSLRPQPDRRQETPVNQRRSQRQAARRLI